jgi:hypothetical protein
MGGVSVAVAIVVGLVSSFIQSLGRSALSLMSGLLDHGSLLVGFGCTA